MFRKLFTPRSKAGLDLSDEQQAYVLSKAYIPEHLPLLMTGISRGTAFLMQDCLGYTVEGGLVLIGYPLSGDFSITGCEGFVNLAVQQYKPERIWLVAAELPDGLKNNAQLLEDDQYYSLALRDFKLKPALSRQLRQTIGRLRFEIGNSFTAGHQQLVKEFIQRQDLPPMVKRLFQSTPAILERSPASCLLNAWDGDGSLSAFLLVDTSADQFNTYVLGCYSRFHYVPHASDRLFFEMVQQALKQGKTCLQLGLGVNEGIRRFKVKWGGKPFLGYKSWEIRLVDRPNDALSSWVKEGKW